MCGESGRDRRSGEKKSVRRGARTTSALAGYRAKPLAKGFGVTAPAPRYPSALAVTAAASDSGGRAPDRRAGPRLAPVAAAAEVGAGGPRGGRGRTLGDRRGGRGRAPGRRAGAGDCRGGRAHPEVAPAEVASPRWPARVWDLPLDHGTVADWARIAERSPFILHIIALVPRPPPSYVTPTVTSETKEAPHRPMCPIKRPAAAKAQLP